ncbi:hypothetical protein LCGC14_1563760 [marine sediment metagenome]|uniref:Tr-type G domain-containing protein n=1 Tax=marine sediment metagenome TaxID=412755 RepID=A0A0F9LMD2_9ZZZZ
MADNKVLPIVIVGHVDHGKSSLIGRILYDTKSLPADTMSDIRQNFGKEDFELAHLVDCFEEERDKSMTIDTSQIFFETVKRHYVIIDAPGHKEFIKNMITGSSQAEAALIVVDVTTGIEEQTKRHAYILKMLGLEQICVLVNKMDAVSYSKSHFDEISKDATTMCSELGLEPSHIIPLSAKTGAGITNHAKETNWFEGFSAVEALDSFKEISIEKKDLRLPVQDIYTQNGKSLIVGRLEAGNLKRGQQIAILPGEAKTKVKTIEKFQQADIEMSSAGECIGITLEESGSLKRGQVIVDDYSNGSSPTVDDTIEANIFWMVEDTYSIGDSLLFKCATQETACSITRINALFDPAFNLKSDENAKTIKMAEVARVSIKLDEQAVTDNFNYIPEMGRFVLENNEQPVAGGIIL